MTWRSNKRNTFAEDQLGNGSGVWENSAWEEESNQDVPVWNQKPVW